MKIIVVKWRSSSGRGHIGRLIQTQTYWSRDDTGQTYTGLMEKTIEAQTWRMMRPRLQTSQLCLSPKMVKYGQNTVGPQSHYGQIEAKLAASPCTASLSRNRRKTMMTTEDNDRRQQQSMSDGHCLPFMRMSSLDDGQRRQPLKAQWIDLETCHSTRMEAGGAVRDVPTC